MRGWPWGLQAEVSLEAKLQAVMGIPQVSVSCLLQAARAAEAGLGPD